MWVQSCCCCRYSDFADCWKKEAAGANLQAGEHGEGVAAVVAAWHPDDGSKDQTPTGTQAAAAAGGGSGRCYCC